MTKTTKILLIILALTLVATGIYDEARESEVLQYEKEKQ